jgi:hypothetical protein
MAMQTLSLILYAAYMSLQPCESVFEETAKKANPRVKWEVEGPALTEFAKAACQTSNPDVLWLIAQQESNFRFSIIRINGTEPKILQGEAAQAFLKELKDQPEGTRTNVDIGALQINWMWHHKGFDSDPLQALSPAKQVDYFLKEFGEEIYRRCDDKWVGCYHNQTSSERSQRYQAAVLKKGKILALKSLYYMRDHRKALSKEERMLLPLVKKDEFYRAFETVGGFPLPRKQILHFVDDRVAPIQAPGIDNRYQG